MNLFCYSSFYPIAWAGGAARCASTIMSNFQFSILNFQLVKFSIFNCFAPLLASLIVNCQLSIVNCFTVSPDNEKLTLPGVA